MARFYTYGRLYPISALSNRYSPVTVVWLQWPLPFPRPVGRGEGVWPLPGHVATSQAIQVAALGISLLEEA